MKVATNDARPRWSALANLLGCLTLLSMGFGSTAFADVIRQTPGSDYLVVEAEDYDEIFGDEFTSFFDVGTDTGEETEFGSELLPVDSNVSGRALFDQRGGTSFDDVVLYQLEFAEPGLYTVYLRYSMYAMVDPEENYANEDSLFFPLELGEEAEQDGWFSLPKHGNDDTTAEPPYWEGNFHWSGPINYSVSQEPVAYEVGPGDVGTVLDFSIGARENGSTLDALIFHKVPDLLADQGGQADVSDELDALLSGNTADPCDFDGSGELDIADIDLLRNEVRAGTNNAAFDLNGDSSVNVSDIVFLVEDESKLNTWIGDANLDGEFNSSDFVEVFQTGEYEDALVANSTWATGDWTGDGEFNSGDFVAAFQSGGFEVGPRPAVAVPEPSALLLLFLGSCAILHRAWSRAR